MKFEPRSVQLSTPLDVLCAKLSRMHGRQLREITCLECSDVIDLAKAAGASGISLSIGGRGTKIYPDTPTYLHFASRASIARDVIEIRGSDLLVGVEVPVETVIEKLAAFAAA